MTEESVPPFLSGRWNGQIIRAARAQPFSIVLSLLPVSSYPSLFGCTLDPNGNSIILEGRWNYVLQTCTFEAKDAHIRFTGVVSPKHPTFVLQGTWEEETGQRGQFACLLEEPNTEHWSGFWVGEATPDPTLADFGIPTNPISWSLTVVKSSLVQGCGYFNDSADVPGQPVLFYTLKGIESNGRITLAKQYESTPETEGYVLQYEGSLEIKDDGPWLSGNWNNEKGGTFGQFHCRLQPPTSTSTHITLCSSCQTVLRPGEIRWSCTTCLAPWNCCQTCQQKPSVHPHPLRPEMAYESTCARGRFSAELAQSAFRLFKERPFIGWRKEGSEEAEEESFHWLTYGQVQADVQRALARLADIPKRREVVVCADLTPNYLVSLLALLLHSSIIVPIHAASPPDFVGRVLEQTKPALVLCDAGSQSIFAKLSPSCPVICLESDVQATWGDKLAEFDLTPLKLTDTSAILYTSGSTGEPKGAVFSEELVLPSEASAIVQPFVRVDFQRFDPSLLLSLLSTMQFGGSRALATDLSRLLLDMQASRPTHIGASPSFWNSLYQDYQSDVQAKLALLPPQQRPSSLAEIERETAAALRQRLGNRLTVATSGGGPIAETVLQWARSRLHLDIVNLYGSRETGGIARDGLVYPGVDVRVISCPELGYFDDSDPPRGEICVHSPRLISGYHNNVNQSAFTKIDGKLYYRTGDVGELRKEGTRTRLTLLDRTSFYFKLANSEWISPARIEVVLEQSPLLSQVLVLPNPTQSAVVAVVVPKSGQAEEGLEERLLAEVRKWCRHHHLRPLEIPQQLMIETEEWTAENGGLTPTFKKKRDVLVKKYKDRFSDSELKPPASNLSVDFAQLLSEILPGTNLDPEYSLPELGADSLAIARLVQRLEKRGTPLPFASLMTYQLLHLDEMLNSSFNPSTVSFDTNWTAEARLPPDLALDLALPRGSRTPDNKRGSCFLTGATGFLGPVLLEALLRQGREVVCLVRPPHSFASSAAEAARTRLISEMKAGGFWEEAFEGQLRVLAGNLESPNFGLSEEEWSDLSSNPSSRPSFVVHNGSNVNMALSYAQLRAANVGGTLTAIRLSQLTGAKLIHISSVSALPPGQVPVEDWCEVSSPQMATKDGYGQTKVIQEQLLKQAHSLGLPVSVFRCSAVSAHRRNGFHNQRDFTVNLLNLCLELKCFVGDSTLRLNWIPVDFVAEAVVALGFGETKQTVFHLTGNGPTLSQVFESLAIKVPSLKRVARSEWAAALAALPESSPLFSLKPFAKEINFFESTTQSLVPVEGTKKALKRLGVEWPDSFRNAEQELFIGNLLKKRK